ncbi:DUF4245 domain-containing protein [Micromonospora sp. WMMD812]|uniref:DUF4245 domain-containing protein n=1 Tax=Micromonospora sp. WMMD812 TaxID=3015152 RepID=UPI00248C0C91|nr:DUF4245 domain-containing protein [Micromonospora sp. WMMD812]WBB64979.1 DUF4245 domain-containing protein [Micromonospora sp. WMMD812]
MEPAQPADRVPAEPTPTSGPTPTGRPSSPGSPSSTGPDIPPPVDGEPALVEPAGTGTPAQPAAPAPGAQTAAAGQPPSGLSPAGVPGPTPTGAPVDSPTPPAAVDARRSERSPKDMAISLLVLLIPIALLLAFYRGFLGGDEANTVDPAPAVEQARAANAFPVSQPADLGSGWRTVSASYRSVDGGANLRIGYVTPEGQGAQLVQSNVPAEQLLPAELTDRAQPQGQADLAGRNWQRYTARENEQALVLLEPGRTVIVVGDAREAELRQLAAALS